MQNMDWGGSAYTGFCSAVSEEEEMRSGFNPQVSPWRAVLGWLGTLWVLLSAPAAAVPQLNVCKNTLALPTAGFGLCTRGVHARDPQIPLWTAHSRAGPQCYQGDGSRGDVDRAVVGR